MAKNRDELHRIVSAEHERMKVALGDLTFAWSDTESVLLHVLRRYAGVTEEVARAIFSGTRASGAIKFIKAIADNTQLDEKRHKDLSEVFSRISTVETMRDLLTHNIDGSLIEFDDEDPTRRSLRTYAARAV